MVITQIAQTPLLSEMDLPKKVEGGESTGYKWFISGVTRAVLFKASLA